MAIDAAGNLIGRWDGPGAGAVMAASHLDTVPRGGWFDGALGVLAAVEAVRQLRAEGFQPARPIWIGSFMDEEGTRFGAALFGSRAFCGEDLSEALGARDADGITVRDAMAARGHSADRLGEANQIGQVDRYLELHIEQGPVLWSGGGRVAVVEAICRSGRDEGRAAGRGQPRRHDADGHAPGRAGGARPRSCWRCASAPPTATGCARPSAGSRCSPEAAT